MILVKSIDHDVEGSHIRLVLICAESTKESATIINAVEAHHGDVERESLLHALFRRLIRFQRQDRVREETIETYTNRLKQLEDITNQFKGVDKSFAIQAGRDSCYE